MEEEEEWIEQCKPPGEKSPAEPKRPHAEPCKNKVCELEIKNGQNNIKQVKWVAKQFGGWCEGVTVCNSVAIGIRDKELHMRVHHASKCGFRFRGNEGNRQLKPTSFFIKGDEKGLNSVTITFNEHIKNHNDPQEENKESTRGFLLKQPDDALCQVSSIETYLSHTDPERHQPPLENKGDLLS